MERADFAPGLIEPVQAAVMIWTRLFETYSLCSCAVEVCVPETPSMRKNRTVTMDVLERRPQEPPREHQG